LKSAEDAPAPPIFEVPSLSPTDRLVGLPPHSLKDARTGGVPRLKTALRLGFRENALLVRFDGRDAGVAATLTGRDAPLWKEDVFEVFLSPQERPTIYYEFQVNPLGAVFDARVESPDLARHSMRVETAWTCAGFSARVTRTERRWSARLKIPLRAMTPGAKASLWRANFYRIDRGSADEYSAWSPTYADPPDFHVPERFGVLRMP
jgi:hypothetical protein